MNHEKRPVALEDLLRLKRAERPPAEFWNEFDRQLRAKQLAALVEKRPWWHGLQRAFSRVGRYQVAFGTAAIVAITFVSTREKTFTGNNAPAAAPAERGVVAVTSAPAGIAGAETTVVAERSMSAEPVSNATADVTIETAEVFPATTSSSASGIAASDQSARALTLISPVEAITASSADSEPVTPSARFIAANFAAVQAADGMSVPLLAASHGFESRAMPARAATIDPLQQMTPPGETRRSSRYLAAMVSTAMADTSPRTAERAANRISAEELYDQVRRFGARQGGFNVKF